MDRSEKTILIVIVALLACCICLVVVSGGLLVFVNRAGENRPAPTLTNFVSPTISPQLTPSAATSTPFIHKDDAGIQETVSILQSVEVPTADLVWLAEKFEGKRNIPRQLQTQPVRYSVGDQTNFYTLNNDENQMNRISASLAYASDDVYFWIEEGIVYSINDLNELMEGFSENIFGRNREFFGSEWKPGVDNDPHLYIVYARNLGSAAGYTSASDGVVSAADSHSNVHEIFYLNADLVELYESYARSVLAHEFQHLIHGYHDPNEEIWLNEGFSELAVFLNGYQTGGFDTIYAFNPDVQLNDWSVNGYENSAHYGASFLFTAYMLDRFGEEITKQVVAEQLNGFTSIDHVFEKNQLRDLETGAIIDSDTFFVDWSISNYLQDPLMADGRYAYHNYPDTPTFFPSETVSDCDNTSINRDVNQYGVEYIEVSCPGKKVTLQFIGDAVVPVVPAGTTQGKFMWSNRADSSVTSLTREFDFRGISAPITLSFETWFDIEADYDYLYLLARGELDSTDQIVNTPTCTRLDPTGNNYQCGYNGSSNGWITEQIDLSKFAGQEVTLSFVYVTDEAVTGEGFIVDNLSILETGETCGFEEGDCGWTSEGFARIGNQVPQEFLVSVLNGSPVAPVQKFRVLPGQSLEVQLDMSASSEPAVVVVSGASRFSRQESSYQIMLKTNDQPIGWSLYPMALVR